ncbi:MAG: DUF4878 domain-containing protein [Treponema sp.]|nr:DUF4878 domain-containing protein [Treponema sp.]
MKRSIITLGVLCLFFAGCSLFNSPSTVVRKFYAAAEKGDYTEMGKYATPDTVSLMAMFGTKIQGSLTAMGKITTVSEKIDGDTAVVTVSFENEEDTEVTLIKTEGKWKVHISMDK